MTVGPKYSVVWAATAAADLAAVADYLAREDIGIALRMIEELHARAAKLESFPFRGRVVPELQIQGIVHYREVFRHPWRILYRVAGNTVYVVTVCDARRNVEDVLLDRFLRGTDQ